MNTLNDFCHASGLKINTLKSKAMCSRMVHGDRKQRIKEISSISFVADLGHYLGFPLVKGRVARNVYNDILDKVSKKLASWKGNLLNKAGRACLVRSVTTAIPVYTMQLHYLPTFVCNRLDKMARSFLWGGDGLSRTWNHVNWHIVTTPKRYGGLGIRDARLTNYALLGKLVWSLLHHQDKLWVKVLTHKYLGQNSIWVNKKNSQPSITWRGIQKAITTFAEGYNFRVGGGESSLWYVDWTKLGPLCHMVPFVNISDSELQLRDVYDNGIWNLQGLSTMLSPALIETIQTVPAPMTLDPRLPDTWTWKHAAQGHYTCSNGYYWLLNQHRNWDVNINMRWIWRLKVPAKVQHFIWLCLHNALPTNARRHHCNMVASSSCTRCSSPMEDLLHCLRECPHSKEVWLRLGMGAHPNFFSQAETNSWIYDMIHSTSMYIFIAGLWQVWCWRNNMIFEEQPWRIHEVLRKVYVSHDEFLDYFLPQGVDVASAKLTSHWTPPPIGYVKVNVDGSFLENCSRMGAGGILRDHTGGWIAGFSYPQTGGDALLAELLAIQRGLELCHTKGFEQIICESDSLEAVQLFSMDSTHALHSYASLILQISEALQRTRTISLSHVPRDHNRCADFLANEGSRSMADMLWDHPPPGLESLILRDKLGS